MELCDIEQEKVSCSVQDAEQGEGKRKRPAGRRKRKRWVRIPLIVLGTLAGIVLLLMGAVALVLPPSRLTPLVNRYANEYLDAEVRLDTVKLSLFRHFPNVGLQIWGGEVVSDVFRGRDSSGISGNGPADTLLRFDEFTVVLNLSKLAFSRVDVRLLRIVRPEVHAYVAEDGTANWDIFGISSPQADTSGGGSDFDIRLNRLSVENAERIVYENRADSLRAEVALERLSLRGRGGRYRIDMRSRNTLELAGISYCDTLPVDLSGGIGFDTLPRGSFFMDGLTLSVAGIPVVFDGTVILTADSIVSDAGCRIEALHLNRLLALVPERVSPEPGRIDTDISLGLDVRIKGSYGLDDGRLPVLRLDCKADGGHLYYKDMKMGMDRFDLDMTACYHPLRPDSVGVDLRKLRAEGPGIMLEGRGSVWNAARDARVAGCLKGEINLTTLSELFPSNRGIEARGRVEFDLDADLKRSHLSVGRIGEAFLKGEICMHDLLLDMPQDTLRLVADHTDITFGADANEQSDTLIDREARLLRFGISSDTLNLDVKNRLRIVAAGSRMNMHSTASVLSGDTTRVHPMTGRIESDYMELNGFDSTWVRSYDASTQFSILPSAEDPAVPMLRLAIGAGELDMRGQETIIELNQSDVELEATLSATRRKMRLRYERMLDSLQRLHPETPRDSLFARHAPRRRLPGAGTGKEDDFASADIDLKVDESIGTLLRRWNASGKVSAVSGRLVTPYMPLDNRLEGINVEFTTDRIKFYKTGFRSGRSDLWLTGWVSNVRRALLGRGNLKVDMFLESDTLNFNELMRAATAGFAYMEKGEEARRTLVSAGNTEELQRLIAEKTAQADTAPTSLFVVPSNVELNLGMYVHYGIYADVALSQLSGRLLVRDRCARVDQLRAVTDAGEMDLTALYATRSKEDIVTGFDLEMKRLQVAKLIALMPAVDTLLPMLRSFEGVVDCQIAATAAMDTTMNIILPTLDGVCRIHGDSMVLLDGETFSEIARMMRFKNRKRNLIDRISVEMIARNNQIEIFPFLIEMDRYKAAVSGVQKLDLSFNYHISVLKSPIPFRLGVNIFGTPDKFKFRICRARYKNENIPTYVGLIDTTRLNLRKNIADIFQKGVRAATLGELGVGSKLNAVASVDTTGEGLSVADSVLLQQEGVLPGADSLSADSLSVVAPASAAGMTESADPALVGEETVPTRDRSGKAEREERRRQKALLREERRTARNKGN